MAAAAVDVDGMAMWEVCSACTNYYSNAKCKVQKRLLVNNATPPQAVMVWLIPSQLSDSGTGVESLL
jgi:hypothetical protein